MTRARPEENAARFRDRAPCRRLPSEPLRAVLGPGEHERALLAADQRRDDRDAVTGVHGEQVVLDLGR
jgi:hypothetical protein